MPLLLLAVEYDVIQPFRHQLYSLWLPTLTDSTLSSMTISEITKTEAWHTYREGKVLDGMEDRSVALIIILHGQGATSPATMHLTKMSLVVIAHMPQPSQPEECDGRYIFILCYVMDR